MGKINKEFQWRMQGILHAREVVSKDGLEGLDSPTAKLCHEQDYNYHFLHVRFLLYNISTNAMT